MSCPACASAASHLKAFETLTQENKIEIKCPVCTALCETPVAYANGVKSMVSQLCASMANMNVQSLKAANVAGMNKHLSALSEGLAGMKEALQSQVPDLEFELPTYHLPEFDIPGWEPIEYEPGRFTLPSSKDIEKGLINKSRSMVDVEVDRILG